MSCNSSVDEPPVLSKFTTLKLSLVVDCVAETKPVVEFESVIFLNLFIVPTGAHYVQLLPPKR